MAHCIAYSEAERLKRFSQAVGEGKMIGTGAKVVAVFHALCSIDKSNYSTSDVKEVLDILAVGMALEIQISLDNPKLEDPIVGK